MTQVEFQVLFPRDVGAFPARYVVIVTANMHQRIFPGSTLGICREGGDSLRNTSADDAAGKRFTEISSFHSENPLLSRRDHKENVQFFRRPGVRR